jgi:transposase
MERLEKKIINGNIYYYYSKWAYVNGKSRRIWQKYLGKLEDIVKAVEGGGPVPQYVDIFQYGLPKTLWLECCRTNIIDSVSALSPKRDQGLSIGDYIAIAAINRAMHPTSKNSLYEWFSKTILRREFPNASEKALSSQRFWYHMDQIQPEMALKIWTHIIKDVIRCEGVDLSSVCYDGTNFYTFIDTFNARCKIAKRGKNKQGRANLRQVSYALFCSAQEQIPLYYNIYDGNLNDTTQFPVMLEQFQEFFNKTFEQEQDIQACQSRVTLIFDKGNNSQDNFKLIDRLKLHYVGSKKLSEVKDVAEISNNDPRFTDCKAIGLENTKAFRVTKNMYGKDRTLVVTYNKELFNTQLLTLHNDISKAVPQLKALQQKLQDRANGVITKGKCPTITSINKQCQSILKRQYMKQVIKYTVTAGSGNKDKDKEIPVLTYSIDTAAIKHLSDTYLGKNLILTDRTEWSNDRIILAYRSQFHIENIFKEMKDRDIGSWWPVYHWTEQKIHVHALYCTIAVLLRALIYRRVKKGGIHISMKRMLRELSAIKEVIIFYPRKRKVKKERRHTVLSKTSELQELLLSILEVKRE